MDTKSLSVFVEDSRAKGLSDETILNSAVDLGLASESVVRIILAGVHIPSQEAVGGPLTPAYTKDEHSPTLTNKAAESRLQPLVAVLHHVILWFFAGSVASAIISLIDIISNSSSYYRNPLQSISTFLAVVSVTGVLYYVFYFFYLKKALREKIPYTTGKVFSLITISFMVIAFLISSISFIVSLINVSYDDKGSTAYSSALLMIVFLSWAATYYASDFLPVSKLRKALLIGSPVVSLLVLIPLFAISLSLIPASTADESTEKNVASTVSEIVEITKNERFLPETYNPEFTDVSYVKTSETTYDICGIFQRDTSDPLAVEPEPILDAYASDWDFKNHTSGTHCFNMENETLGIIF